MVAGPTQRKADIMGLISPHTQPLLAPITSKRRRRGGQQKTDATMLQAEGILVPGAEQNRVGAVVPVTIVLLTLTWCVSIRSPALWMLWKDDTKL